MINCKEQTVLESIKDFLKENICKLNTVVLGYKIDLYFREDKLAIKVDELGHNVRNSDYEIQKQRAIEKELGCVFVRINPDEENFNIFTAINEIH